MKFIEETIYETLPNSKILQEYFSGLKVGIFDIETTGLNADKTRIILGGLAIPHWGCREEPDYITALQYFAETPADEIKLLQNYTESLHEMDILISYNGNRFDIPFLERRLFANKMPPLNLQPAQSFDLYQGLNKFSELRKILPNLKQKTVENYMGLWTDRNDEISGAESVELYYEYLRTKDERLEKFILLHNCDDLFQLTRLLEITGKLDLHRIMHHNGFVIFVDRKYAYVNQIKRKKNTVEVRGALKNVFMNYKSYGEHYHADFTAEQNSFYLKLFFNSTSESLEYGDINRKIRITTAEILSAL